MRDWTEENTKDHSANSRFKTGHILNGQFEVLELIGKGGIGTVYKAKDLQVGTIVAVKLIDSSLRLAEDTATRLDREIRNAYAVRSDYVANLYSLFVTETNIGLVLEYVDGKSLYDLQRDGYKFTIQEITQIGRQVALGLDAVHKLGIVHRDIKLENIVLSNSSVAKITDFGVSLVQSASTNQPNTGSGARETRRVTNADQVVGTIHYLAPEYLTDQICDRRLDIYALGIVLYELVTGRFPYQFSSPLDLVEKKVRTDPPPPSYYAPDCPDWLEDIILKSMERDLDRRYQGTVMIIEELGARLRDPDSFTKQKPNLYNKISSIIFGKKL